MNNASGNNRKANNNSFPIVKINIIYLGIFIGVCVLGYLLYKYINTLYRTTVPEYIQNVLIEKRDGKDGKILSATLLPVSLYGSEYNLSFWLNVNSYTYKYGTKKNILTRGDTEIYLNPTENHLHVKVTQLVDEGGDLPTQTCPGTKPTETTSTTEATTTTTTEGNIEGFNDLSGGVGNVSGNNTNGLKHNTLLDIVAEDNKHMTLKDCIKVNVVNADNRVSNNTESFVDTTDTEKNDVDINSGLGKSDECIVYNFPLQRWVHVAVNFYDNMIEIYIDGKLSSSCNLKVTPSFNTSDIRLLENEGFDGKLNKLTYSNVKLSSHQIYNLYKTGP